VGQYNVSNLKVQPSYGLWARHVQGLTVQECSFNYEKRDSRYALFLDDVVGARLSSLKMVRAQDNQAVIKIKNSPGVTLEKVIYFEDTWGKAPREMPRIQQAEANGTVSFPAD
jgi:hypothetical protein